MPRGNRRAPARLRIACAVGAESTGKTRLCRRLARHFDVPWLPEYAREYLGKKPGANAPCPHNAYDENDVATIAREQIRREQALLRRVDSGVVLDTDLAVIVIWWREKFGALPTWIETAFAAQAPRLYLLCRPDLPWRPDPLRESPHDRQRLHEQYRRLLSDRQLPFVEIGGSGEARFQAAFAAARHCLTPTPPPLGPSFPPAV